MRRLGTLFSMMSFMSGVQAHAAIRYEAILVDPANEIGDDRELLLANFDAAVADWGRFIAARGVLKVELRVTMTHSGRFGGSSALFAPRGRHTFEGSGMYKLRTGRSLDRRKPDIVIEIEPNFMRANYWMDPRPSLRVDEVPPGKIDLVTVLAHELGHGMGFEGFRSLQTGEPPADGGLSLFDRFVDLKGAPTFRGSKTVAAYGRPLPLTFFASHHRVQLEHKGHTYRANASPSQNIYHYGRFWPDQPDEPESSFRGLMAGVWVRPPDGRGLRIRVGPLDAAILGDLGLPLVGLKATRS
jgi:hypothetical protein